MGSSASGILIKCNPGKYDLTRIVRHFFGEDFKSDWDEGRKFDTRHTECVSVTRLQNAIFISNADFANLFFINSAFAINRIYNYFSNIEYALAFIEVDSGGTYGYCALKNAKLVRMLRSISHGTLQVIGDPIPEDADWFAQEPRVEIYEPTPEEYYPEDAPKQFTIYKNQNTGQETDGALLVHDLLWHIMFERFGYITWNMHEFTLENKMFKINGNWIENIYGEKSWL